MPTVIVLDVSLSMTRLFPQQAADQEQHTYHSLAVRGIYQFLDFLAKTSRLEHVSLLVFSTLFEVLVDFTRDYDAIKLAIAKVEHYDRSNLTNMMQGVKSMLLSSWGSAQNYSHVLVFTDCGIGLGPSSIRHAIATLRRNEPTASPVPAASSMNALFTCASKLSFVCIGQPEEDAYFRVAVGLYQELLDVSGQHGELFMPMGNVVGDKRVDVMRDIITRMCETNYKPFEAVLKCGGYAKLECAVSLWPKPMPHVEPNTEIPRQINRKIEICGYLALADIGSPMSLSRHLILPLGHLNRTATSNATTTSNAGSSNVFSSASGATSSCGGDVVSSQSSAMATSSDYDKLEADIKAFYSKSDRQSNSDDECVVVGASATLLDSTTESVCVLLHGALKTDNLAALVTLGDNWFGFVYSHGDGGKKKSNLMLTVLPPGHNCVPWLGDLRLIGTAEDLFAGETPTYFPVKPEKRSYSQNCVVWIRVAGLQADIQKIQRHAKKMPEKIHSYYKELNRICRAALAMGFVELLEGLSNLLDREATLLPANANPDCALQLKHSTSELRKLHSGESKGPVLLLPTKYNQM